MSIVLDGTAGVTTPGLSSTSNATVTGTLGVTTGAAVGGATPGAGGIAFPATAVSVANVNTLDDYEEGTWTPTILLGGANVGMTYTSQTGSYTKIGNTVHVSFDVTMNVKGSSTGSVAVGALPFSVNASYNFGASIYFVAITIAAGFTPVGLVLGGGTAIGGYWEVSATGVSAIQDTSVIASNTRLIGSATYFI